MAMVYEYHATTPERIRMSAITSGVETTIENAVTPAVTGVADTIAEKIASGNTVVRADLENLASGVVKLGADLAQPLLVKGLTWLASKAGVTVA